jgi:hypothetical protein
VGLTLGGRVKLMSQLLLGLDVTNDRTMKIYLVALAGDSLQVLCQLGMAFACIGWQCFHGHWWAAAFACIRWQRLLCASADNSFVGIVGGGFHVHRW